MCLDFGSNRTTVMVFRDDGSGLLGRGFQFSRIPSLDFVPKKGSLAISDGGM
jgi:hypothetical protein